MNIVTGAMYEGKKQTGEDDNPITPAIGATMSDHEFNEFMSVMKGENTPPSTSPSNLTKAKLVLAAAFSPMGEISRARKCMDLYPFSSSQLGVCFTCISLA